MNPIDQLKSLLCDPEGKCCIAGSDKDRAIVDRALEALAQPKQGPVFWYRPRSDGRYEGPIHNAMIEKVRRESGGWMPLYTSPPASMATSEDVLVPIGILEAAEISLGSFCSNEGWSADDMQTMDNLSAYIAKHKAAHGIKKAL